MGLNSAIEEGASAARAYGVTVGEAAVQQMFNMRHTITAAIHPSSLHGQAAINLLVSQFQFMRLMAAKVYGLSENDAAVLGVINRLRAQVLALPARDLLANGLQLLLEAVSGLHAKLLSELGRLAEQQHRQALQTLLLQGRGRGSTDVMVGAVVAPAGRVFGLGCWKWDGTTCARERQMGRCSFASTHTPGMCTEAYALNNPTTQAAVAYFARHPRG